MFVLDCAWQLRNTCALVVLLRRITNMHMVVAYAELAFVPQVCEQRVRIQAKLLAL
jgi:hypothetical protein